MENFYDLQQVPDKGFLNKCNTNEYKNIGTYEVKSEKDLMNLVQNGLQKKMIHTTMVSMISSRITTVLNITLDALETVDEKPQVRTSTLFLVDLISSDRPSKLIVNGANLTEFKQMTRSSSNLQKVISALTSDSNYIPYRDSKLTLVLSNTLGGN
mmetsp:Transcript_22686/g.20166  ORF Transcript_22686/g.20166 Transcript_22686/m.20166 type:complete len:155 (+) Transcript_22686:451-915(+)